LKLALERAGDYALEERRLRGTFEILVAAESFGEEPGETRADFETTLSNTKKLKEFSMLSLVKLVDSTINKHTVVGATDSVLSLLKDRSVAEATQLITV